MAISPKRTYDQPSKCATWSAAREQPRQACFGQPNERRL
jgi:hypothetical protein